MRSQITLRVIFILNRWDPEGLAPGGGDHDVPEDEYELEATDIAATLRATGAINVEQLNAIWQHWFGNKIATRRDAQVIASQLSDLVGPGTP